MRLKEFVCATAFVSALTATAGAQEMSGNGYLFGAPSGSVSLRFGYAGANAGSDLFSYATHDFTLHRSDFGSFAVGGDLGFALSSRWDILVSVDVDGMEKQSEYREWQDNSGNPIEQRTAFSRQTYMLSAKYYFTPYGRTLGKLAWVPRRWAPWASLGVGRTSYEFSQNGDFIDFNNGNRVQHDALRSSTWGTTAQASAGVDWNLTPRFALTTQLRYLFGSAGVNTDYSGFQPIDLSGLGMTAGLTLRY